MDVEIETAEPHRIFQDGCIADDEGPAELIELGEIEGLDADFGADAAWIPHGDTEKGA